MRISAISAASVDLLRGLGVWETVLAMRAHPYSRLETWEWENAHVAFDAAELKLPRLGYMVENNVLQLALWQALEAHPKVTLRVPASLKALHPHESGDHHQLTFEEGESLTAKLVVGADGANSQVRQMAGIGVHAWQYQQSCMLITVECEAAAGESTWQHFTPDGPHAFLPLFDNWASLVWYDKPARIRQLQGLTMEQLQREIVLQLSAASGARHAGRGGGVPAHAPSCVAVCPPRPGAGGRCGTHHSSAGRAGRESGVSRCRCLAGCAYRGSVRGHGEAWASHAVLKRYQTRRMADNFIMQCGMDLFYAGFSNDLGPVRILRNIGLMAAERAGGLKRQALKYALGL